jgi:FAD/FMN-containing dehydrogenase
LIATIPDALTLMPTFFAAPDGKLSLVLHHSWCGDPSQDQRMIEQVRSLGDAAAVKVSRKTLAEILREAEKRTMDGVCWIVRTVTLAGFAPEAVEVIQRAMEHRSSPLSWIAAHPFYGAGERIAVEATAFGIRQRHFMVGIYTAWHPGEEAPHRAWADEVEAALKPYALASSYPNYFDADRPVQAAQAYGQNAERLLRVKDHYDPQHLFQAIALPLER